MTSRKRPVLPGLDRLQHVGPRGLPLRLRCARPARADRQLPCWHGRRAGGRGAQTVQCLLDGDASCPPDMGAGGPRPAAPQERPVDGLTWASTVSGDGTRARPRLRPTSCLRSWAMTARHGGPRRRGSAIRRPVGPSDMGTAGRGTGPLCMAGRCPPESTPDTGTFARHLAHPGGSAVLQGRRASRQGYQLGAKVDGLALPRGGGPALGAGTWGLRRLASGARSLR